MIKLFVKNLKEEGNLSEEETKLAEAKLKEFTDKMNNNPNITEEEIGMFMGDLPDDEEEHNQEEDEEELFNEMASIDK